MRKTFVTLTVTALLAQHAGAYTPYTANPTRADFANVQFSYNSVAPGAYTAQCTSTPLILNGVDVPAAIKTGMDRWKSPNSRTALNFAVPTSTTNTAMSVNDGVNVIHIISNSTAINMAQGSPASTYSRIVSGQIVESDIYINSSSSYCGLSTLQISQLIQHEMGHALGLKDGFIRQSAMYGTQRTTMSDDLAFVDTFYPGPRAALDLGSVGGRATFATGGTAVRGGHVSLVDDAQGLLYGRHTDASGNFTVSGMLPGSYTLIIEPNDYPNSPPISPADTAFLTTCLGGCDNPTKITVTAGVALANQNLSIAAGSHTFGPVIVYAASSLTLPSPYWTQKTQEYLRSGYTTKMAIVGPGIDTNLAQSSYRLQLGGVTFAAVLTAGTSPSFTYGGVTYSPVITNFAATTTAKGWGSLWVKKGNEWRVATGSLGIRDTAARGAEEEANSVVNAASFAPGPLAPDSVATLLIDGLTDSTESNVSGTQTDLAGVSITIIDSSENSHSAGLLLATARQINFLVPAEVASGPAVLLVTGANGDVQTLFTEITATAPGLFAANADGKGVAAGGADRLVRLHDSDTGSSELVPLYRDDLPIGFRTPLALNLGGPLDEVTLQLLATGLRRTDAASVSATVGGEPVQVMRITPESAPGVDSIALGPLPHSLSGKGAVDIEISVEGRSSNVVKIVIQ